jgi:peroxiredoxin
MCVVVLFAVVAVALPGVSIQSLLYGGSAADWELQDLRQQLKEGAAPESIREQSLAIALAHPDTRAEVSGLTYVIRQWPDSTEADVATNRLLESLQNTSLDDLRDAFQDVRPGQGEFWNAAAAVLLDRVRQQPAHPACARLLADAALASRPGPLAKVAPARFIEVADLICEKYAASSDLANFCEMVSNMGNPAEWQTALKSHMQTILEANEDRFVRCCAHFALATAIRSEGSSGRVEARDMYQEFLNNFDGNTSYDAQAVEQRYREMATRAIAAIEAHGIGLPAPVTRGVDIHGNSLALEDYRGKVVLMTFWASWCKPCLQAVTMEHQLLETFADRDFAIFGMNVDNNIKHAVAAAEKHGMTWRSLQTAGDQPDSAKNWTVDGYPTFYLLDREGIVLNSWVGIPAPGDLQAEIERVVAITAN